MSAPVTTNDGVVFLCSLGAGAQQYECRSFWAKAGAGGTCDDRNVPYAGRIRSNKVGRTKN
jgi:hypothetical protein